MILTRRFSFESSHYLDNPKLSAEECAKIFGACSGYKGSKQGVTHGHSYKMEISVSGIKNLSSGFLINFKDLKTITNEEVVSILDHNCLNDVIPEPYHPVTVENMISFIHKETALFERIRKTASGMCYINKIKIWETEDSCAEENFDHRGDVIQ